MTTTTSTARSARTRYAKVPALGGGPVTLGGLVLFVALVGYLAIRRPDIQETFEDLAARPAGTPVGAPTA